MDDEHALGEPLDLFEDVRREQDHPARGGHRREQLHHVQPLARVHAVERLVEEQHRRLVDERRGHLDALAHPLRVRRDGPSLGRLEVDGADRPLRGGVRIGEALEPGVEPDELEAGEEAVHALALGDQAEPPVEGRVAPGRLAGDQHLARRGAQEPGQQVEQRRLARAVGPEEAGDPRTRSRSRCR